MRLRSWCIAILIGLNLVLAAAWYIAYIQEYEPPVYHPKRFDLASRMTKTNVVVRRLSFDWTQLASTNLATYVANLGGIGCPPGIIRDLVLAEVNEIFEHRRVTEVVTPDQQWWKADTDGSVAHAAAARFADLETERRATLNAALGSNWTTGLDVVAWLPSAYGLTGPQLGELPPVTKRAVYDIVTRTREILANQNPRDAARIRQEERMQLLTVLTPEQFAEFLLRFSYTAQQLREQIGALNLSQNQFRSLFSAVDPIASQPDYYDNSNDPELADRRQILQAQYETAMKQSLGEDLYAGIRLNQDTVYLTTADAVRRSELPDQAIMPIYEINRATQAELNRIRSDPTLSDDEKIEALATTRAEQQKSIAQLLGPEPFQRWLRTQTNP